MPDQSDTPPDLFAAALAERYAFERALGRGASAVVYLAHDRKHGRRVAIKVLDATRAAAAARFRREIGMVAQLQHPHVLPLYDSGEAAGRPYFVMPYVAGETLRARLRARGALPPADALRLAVELADALGYAHVQGVVHRDVKPENVLLTGGPAPAGRTPNGHAPNGQTPNGAPAPAGEAVEHALLSDFGIARLTHADGVATGDGGRLGSTSTGHAVGTLAYMAPEQASADPNVGPRADVFALGVVVYEMLTGVVPYADVAAAPEALRLRLTGPPARLGRRAPRLPRRAARLVDAVLARAMTPEPAARYATAAEMVAPLQEALGAAAERAPGPFGSARARWAMALGAAGLAAAAYWLASRRDVLDPELVLVLPFAEERAGPVAIDGRDAEQLLVEAMGRWTDLRLVNATRVNDLMARTGRRAPRSLEDALAMARELGAGRLAWGSVGRAPGAPGRVGVRAALYNVSHPGDALLREHRVTAGQALPELNARFGELADSLLISDAGSPAAVAGASGTRVWSAWRAYARGHDALARWDLDGAARAFGAATARDPDYALAYLWRAQAFAWMRDAPRPEWQAAADRAAALAPRLTPASALAARALAALADARYPEACGLYRRLVRRDSLDYAAWYGLGDCQANDSLAVADPASPSGWRFRSSWRDAQLAYERVLANLPSLHLAFGGSAVRALPRLLIANGNQVRVGYAVTGRDTTRVLAQPSLDADTLAFVPWPAADVSAVRPGTVPPTLAAARDTNRRALLRVAERWEAAFPRSADVLELLAVAQESAGRLAAAPGVGAGALETVWRARRLATDPDMQRRLALTETRLALKLGRFAAAKQVADSLLAAAPPLDGPGATAVTGEAAHDYAVLAALTGRPAAAAAWARQAVGGATASPADQAGVTLMAYAAVGGPREALLAARARALRAVHGLTAPAAGDAAAGFAQAMSLAYPTLGAVALDGVAVRGDYMLELQAAAARGDRALVQQRFRALAAERRGMSPGDLSTDAVYLEAWLHAWSGDTAAATALLQRTIDDLAVQGTLMLDQMAVAAALPRALALRAELAGRQGDALAARRAGDAARILWRDADPGLRTPGGP